MKIKIRKDRKYINEYESTHKNDERVQQGQKYEPKWRNTKPTYLNLLTFHGTVFNWLKTTVLRACRGNTIQSFCEGLYSILHVQGKRFLMNKNNQNRTPQWQSKHTQTNLISNTRIFTSHNNKKHLFTEIYIRDELY